MFSITQLFPSLPNLLLPQTMQKKMLSAAGISLIAGGLILTFKRDKTIKGTFNSMSHFRLSIDGLIISIKKQSTLMLQIKVIKPVLFFLGLFLGQKAFLFSADHKIVFIRGTCSAGKSSICEKIAARKSHWHVIDLDQIYMKKVVDLVASTFPNEYSILAREILPQNLYHAIKRNEWKINETEHEASQALLKIQQTLNGEKGKDFQATLWNQLNILLVNEIRIAFQEGKDVLMDSWLSKDGIIEKTFKNEKIINVLIYTPFETSYSFLQKRNQEAAQPEKLYKKRFLGQFFSSFNKHYRLTIEKSDRTLTDLSRSRVDSIFNSATHCVLQNWNAKDTTLFTQNEINLSDLNKIKNEFLPEEAQRSDRLFLEPKENYDIVIFTVGKSAEELSDLLLAKLK